MVPAVGPNKGRLSRLSSVMREVSQALEFHVTVRAW
jgi:hypothetical protein